MKAVSPRVNINKTRLLVDAGALASSLVATAPRFSGLSIHEWLSIGLAVVNVARLMLIWARGAFAPHPSASPVTRGALAS